VAGSRTARTESFSHVVDVVELVVDWVEDVLLVEEVEVDWAEEVLLVEEVEVDWVEDVLLVVNVEVVVAGHSQVTLWVALREPVKFEPPPPRAPPVTNALKFSGVPAWSAFWYTLAMLSSTGFTPRALLSVLNVVYTAAAHCQLMLTPALLVNWPLHVTGLIPPGKSTGTWNAKPLRNVFPPSPVGVTVSHVLVAVLKTVVASVAAGSNVT